ncbi:MAG: HlyD family efflux transporter periplasmic adaptor subunit [Flavobacteriales bacterium]|nr:HlyD family efflux transporter periplasmic adaptor subunit [Flavobacteriales bacterium]
MKIFNIVFVAISLVSCSKGDIEADAYGNFEVDELTVSAETGGKLLSFIPIEGQHIEAGEPVAVIDTLQLFLKKKQVEASMEALQQKLPNEAAQLAVYDERISKLRAEIERVAALVAASAAPSKQLDDLNSELLITEKQRNAVSSNLTTQSQSLLAELEPMKYQLLQLEDQISRAVVNNPISGTVLTTLVKSGELAAPGRALYQIASLDPIVLRAYVTEDLLSNVQLGGVVTVKTDGADGQMVDHKGTVTWISSEAEFTPKMIQTRDERTTQVYAVKINVPNNGGIKIGMPAEVYLHDTDLNQ